MFSSSSLLKIVSSSVLDFSPANSSLILSLILSSTSSASVSFIISLIKDVLLSVNVSVSSKPKRISLANSLSVSKISFELICSGGNKLKSSTDDETIFNNEDE